MKPTSLTPPPWLRRAHRSQGQRLAADAVNYATGGVVVIDYPVQDGGASQRGG
ncbi:hypothetical protein [Mycolicibacterium frederiksbergense]|uniref:hypothetical protein n=1 Tax=Mycolicibacterium frederiksbergense TaxID=117567 RepID=UPI00399BE352